MENWKGLFRPHILERGLNYYGGLQDLIPIKGVQESELIAIFTVTFNSKTMYSDFLKSRDYLDNKDKWSITDNKKYIMQLKF